MTSQDQGRSRLLLDAHFAPRVAASLREAGHDVVALMDLPGGATMADLDVFALAVQLDRRVATENVRDFRPLLTRALQDGSAAAALLLVPAARFSRSRAATGQLLRALEVWLSRPDVEHPLEDWLR